MTLYDLVRSTAHLPIISADILLEIQLKKKILVQEIQERQSNSLYRTIFEYELLKSSFSYFSPDIFISDLLDLYNDFYQMGLPMSILVHDFKNWQKSCSKHLSKNCLKKVIPYIRWIINYHHHLVTNVKFSQLVSES